MKKSIITAGIIAAALTLCSAPALWASSADSTLSSVTDMASKASSVAEKLNINTASTEALSKIPGLSTIAEKITSYREANGAFSSLTDLLNIDGIDSSLLEKITPFLSL